MTEVVRANTLTSNPILADRGSTADNEGDASSAQRNPGRKDLIGMGARSPGKRYGTNYNLEFQCYSCLIDL